MNKGFILYEGIAMFLIISIILLTCLNLNNKLAFEYSKINKKITEKNKTYYERYECSLICIIEKVF